MLAAAHTRILMDIFRRSGRPARDLFDGQGSLMALGNLLPDTLPLVGVPAEKSHDPSRAASLKKEFPAVGLGMMVHLYADNITHCGELESCGSYDKSMALKLGFEWHKKSGGRFDGLLGRIKGKSLPYVLHLIIEISSDVVLATDEELTALISNTWGMLWKHDPSPFGALAAGYDMDPQELSDRMKKFRSAERPPPEAIYSRAARARLFTGKFSPDLKEGDRFDDEDLNTVCEMIAAGEEMVKGEIEDFVSDSARRIMDHSEEITRFVENLEQGRV